MTSRISFFKLIKEEWRHHLVSIFLLAFVYLMKLLFFYFDIQSRQLSEPVARAWMLDRSIPAVMPALIAGFFGVLLAVDYFSYLHSKRKSDFYLSLPIRRKEQFFLGMAMSGLLFIIPFALEVFGELMLVIMKGYGSTEIVSNFLGGGLSVLLIFCATWITTAFAMVSTGNIAIALLGTGLLSLYVPVILASLFPLFEDYFYDTYLYITERSVGWDIFSPASLAYGLVEKWGNTEAWSQYFVACIFYIVILGMATLVLYTKRPAEAAGKAMAFERGNNVVKFMIVIPLSLYFGWFIMTMSVQNSLGWLIAGTIFGTILLHGIVESIYSFDMHQMWQKKGHMVMAVAGCMLFLFVMKIGGNAYDCYKPSVNDLKFVEVNLNNEHMNFNTSYRESDGVRGEKLEEVLQLAELAMEQDENQEGVISFKYYLKNGSIRGRRYKFDLQQDAKRELLDQIVATEDFKDDFYNIYHIDSEQVTDIELDDGVEERKIDFTPEEKKELLEICKKELSEISLTDMESQVRIAKLMFSNDEEGREEFFPIYEQFTQTRAYLEDKGISIGSFLEQGELVSIEASSEYGAEEPWELNVKDKELLESVKHQIVLTDFYGWDSIYHIRNATYANVCLEKAGRIMYRNVYLPGDVLQILMNGSEN